MLTQADDVSVTVVCQQQTSLLRLFTIDSVGVLTHKDDVSVTDVSQLTDNSVFIDSVGVLTHKDHVSVTVFCQQQTSQLYPYMGSVLVCYHTRIM